ncbi:MAG: NUDIX hydrolase [Cyclobacteriaceae bacterium]|nr:NUDIX hydrolase [Cyclobacteriaceae bacterium HetDA_MAG_MS6]
MKIFINDIPVILMKASKVKNHDNYDLKVNGKKEKIIPKLLMDDVLILNASAEVVEELLQLMTDKKFKKVDSITFASDDKDALVAFIKDKFSIVEAAGGVVEKEGLVLLIHRLGKWDLPKGKLDKGEKRRACAIREVGEETGVKVKIQTKIGHTWHTYMRNKKYVLKKTHWYAMTSLDDSMIAPQYDEDIDDVRWMTLSEMRSALYNSYRTIRSVIQAYNKLLRIQSS